MASWLVSWHFTMLHHHDPAGSRGSPDPALGVVLHLLRLKARLAAQNLRLRLQQVIHLPSSLDKNAWKNR